MASFEWDRLVWRQASELIQQAERIQRNFLQVAVGTHYQGTPRRMTCWAPPVNEVETGETLWVLSALPGVAVSQIEARIEAGELIITGRRSLPECCQEGEFVLWEIPLGPFERRLRLPPAQLFSLGKTRFEDGLLVIELQKH